MLLLYIKTTYNIRMDQEKNVQKINYAGVKQAAKKLFLNNGYGKTSMNDIATELSIRKSSLYHHIISREQLLIDIVNDIENNFHQSHNTIENIADTTIRKQKASELMITSFNAQSELGLLVKLLHEVEHDTVKKTLCNVINRWIQQLKNLFNNKQHQEKAAEHIHFLVGAMIFHKACQHDHTLNDYIKELVRLF